MKSTAVSTRRHAIKDLNVWREAFGRAAGLDTCAGSMMYVASTLPRHRARQRNDATPELARSVDGWIRRLLSPSVPPSNSAT